MSIRTVHPFPARMAPELALASLAELAPGSTVLDPMAGSGTVLRQALALGHRALGFDMDPLAVLMSRVWTTPVSEDAIDKELESLLADSQAIDLRSHGLHWFDEATREFVAYWFDAPQRRALTRLAYVLDKRRQSDLSPSREAALNVLCVGLSRIIVTKEQGASLARDTSHSRPHKVVDTSSYDVYSNFIRSVTQLKRRMLEQPPTQRARVELGDARRIRLPDGSVNAVLTSPPYLNAIDYMRGHRMSLVWLGYTLHELRSIRSTTIGAERAADLRGEAQARRVAESMCALEGMENRHQRMIERYAGDLIQMLSQVARVLNRDGHAMFVVGNSCLKDTFIRNSDGVARAAELAGLRLTEERVRDLPAASRYLPMTTMGALSKRMRTETVMTFKHAA